MEGVLQQRLTVNAQVKIWSVSTPWALLQRSWRQDSGPNNRTADKPEQGSV